MSVTSVRELFTGRQGSFDTTRAEATRCFRLTTNSPYDDEQSIFASGMLPAFGTAHPRAPSLFARRFRANQENGAYTWRATVDYDNQAAPLPQLAKEIQPNPLQRRVKVRGKTVAAKEALTQAAYVTTQTLATFFASDVYPIPTNTQANLQSSSYEAFEGYERFADQFVWEIEWNVDYIPFWVTSFQNTINDSAVQLLGLTLPRRTLMLRNFSHSDLLSEQVGYVTVEYYKVQFELHYRSDRWFLGIADRGFYKLVSGKQQRITLDDGRMPVNPVPLDGSGAIQASPTNTSILYRWYAPYPEKNFNVLPIPPSA